MTAIKRKECDEIMEMLIHDKMKYLQVIFRVLTHRQDDQRRHQENKC